MGSAMRPHLDKAHKMLIFTFFVKKELDRQDGISPFATGLVYGGSL